MEIIRETIPEASELEEVTGCCMACKGHGMTLRSNGLCDNCDNSYFG
jgi:hypothetical protein